MERGDGGKGGKKGAAGVGIDDCTFHRCVQLGKFDTDRTITFVPPDGEFELMKYRITENVNLPFRVIPSIEEHGATKVVLNIKAIANFSSQLFATNVAIKIPVRACVWRCFFFFAFANYAAAPGAPRRASTTRPPSNSSTPSPALVSTDTLAAAKRRAQVNVLRRTAGARGAPTFQSSMPRQGQSASSQPVLAPQ